VIRWRLGEILKETPNTLKLPSDYVATVKALLNTPPPQASDKSTEGV
jgi:hypothetical protein